MDSLEQKKYPIGRFEIPFEITDQDIDHHIKVIKNFPKKIKHLVEDLSDDQLDEPYRKDGWKIRQVINHLADSHMNAFIRFKLALTEDNPVIKAYDEAQWAELQDSFSMGIDSSLKILDGVHKRWVYEMKCLTNKEFEHTFFHPQQNRVFTLKESLTQYSWHCNHHFAHIKNLMLEKKWI
ncbi:YfiT family bacillithiol transferase [Halpernia frigidisoli]|uniref:DinB superfamily protein n=1 Tax=Halpernia frigidisoli TaxID=1125876 RepID=A0A1I3DVC4_9FLAO|nr:putative metal-dependent hydrolase [Halpernia frigidisoli]SFH90538.1 DinB superfamily protein [Halpernia frigidisoli]